MIQQFHLGAYQWKAYWTHAALDNIGDESVSLLPISDHSRKLIMYTIVWFCNLPLPKITDYLFKILNEMSDEKLSNGKLSDEKMSC